MYKVLLSNLITLAALGIPFTPTAQGGDSVEGLSGSVEIVSASQTYTSTLIFRPTVPAGANTRVFLLQHVKGSALPSQWSGRARVFLADGAVGLVAGKNIRWLFKFPDREIPTSLKNNFEFQVFDVFGIARYGETAELSKEQIESLKKPSFCANQSVSGTISPLNQPAPCSDCTSGGVGSTSCSSGGGGCSVSCTTSFWACCNGNANKCYCCKSAE